jgi:hypothetical protein
VAAQSRDRLGLQVFAGSRLDAREVQWRGSSGTGEPRTQEARFHCGAEGESEQEPKTAKDWSQDEVRLIVADFFAMLEAELKG